MLMTEDHRVASQGERARLLAAGIQLSEKQIRLNGMYNTPQANVI